MGVEEGWPSTWVGVGINIDRGRGVVDVNMGGGRGVVDVNMGGGRGVVDINMGGHQHRWVGWVFIRCLRSKEVQCK